jgi:hypothetical protein
VREGVRPTNVEPNVPAHHGTIDRLIAIVRSGEMEFIKDYWWILVILLMVGVLMNVYKDLKRIDHKKFMDNKPDLPPHRDFNDKWDDDDWPKKK